MEYMNPQFSPIDTTSAQSPAGVGASSAFATEWEQQQHQQQQQVGLSVETGLEDAMWRMHIRPPEGMETRYPERPGEQDCPYYMKTGLCGFGPNCKFNHPPERRLLFGSRGRAEYPERPGQPECQYYIKNGTCKFGPSCKYHHPREIAGTPNRTQFNIMNLPLRPGEKDCAYYLQTGKCKYGVTCKFNHPPPLVPMPGSPFPGAPPGPSYVPQMYPHGLPGWPMPGPPYLSSPRLAGPPNLTSILVPPPQVPVPPWNAYQLPIAMPEGQQQPMAANFLYGTAVPPQDPVQIGLYSHLVSSPAPMRLPTPPSPSTPGPREEVYPERPGQPECQYYMRTGNCRYGSQCKFHHPRERAMSAQTVFYNPMGFPLRPGAPPCTFFNRHGYCKFGPTCKFDHSNMPATAYSQSVPMPLSQYGAFGQMSTVGVPSPSESSLEAYIQPTSSEMVGEGSGALGTTGQPIMDLSHGSS